MSTERLDLANKMVLAIMLLPDDLKLAVYQRFIFVEDEGDMMAGVETSNFIPNDEGLKKEIIENFMYWDIEYVKRCVTHAEGVVLIDNKGLNDSLIMTAVNGNVYCMETMANEGAYLSMQVTVNAGALFVFNTDKTPLDYLMDSLIDVEVEFFEE